MILSEQLESIPGNRTLVLSRDCELTTDAARRSTCIARRAAAGARIGIHLDDPAAALQLLAALDGIAELVLLISPTAAPDEALRLASQCSLDGIISGACDAYALANSTIRAFRDLEGFASSFARRPMPACTQWVLTTSGTTGDAKPVGHTFTSLTRTTKVDVVRGATVRWGLLYDYTRFAGLQVLLQSVLSGSTLIAPAVREPLDARLAFFAEHGCTHLSGTPTMWRRILMAPGSGDLRLKQATLGGEIADDRILAAVSRFYPQARMTHIFASTEAGVGFAVTDRRAGFPLDYLTDPPSGIEVAVRNDRLFVRNPYVLPHYLNNAAASFGDQNGWIDTGDVVEIVGDRVLFRGRASGVINIGGDKVLPEEVEHVLLSHPLVSIVRVYSKPNPITGALVAADIVLANQEVDAASARQELHRYALERLGRTRAPAVIKIVRDVNSNFAGKLARG